jgi:hypothetical protein
MAMSIWIKGSDGSVAPPGDYRALLRLYCVESWPKPPSSHDFDTIMLGSETRTVISAGEWVAGAAFSHQDSLVKDPQAPRSSTSAIRKFRYVGRLLIERLQNHEIRSSSRTIMFEGSSKAEIDEQGVWSVRRSALHERRDFILFNLDPSTVHTALNAAANIFAINLTVLPSQSQS